MSDVQFGIKITADGKQAAAELGQVNAAIGKTETASKRAGAGLSAMETGLKGLGSAASLAKGMLAGMAGALTVGEYIKAADAFNNLSSRMQLVTGTVGEYRQAMADSVAAAQRYGMALDDVGKLYARLSPITQDLGRSQAELNTVMAGIGASLKVSGATAAEASSTITQLTQAMASANVQWEDFGQLLDTNPALVRSVEQALQPLVAQYGSLKEAISKGKVSNEELFDALKRSSAAFQQQADTMNGTVGNAWIKLKNSLEIATGKIDGTIGASKALSGTLGWLSKTVDTAAEAFRRFFNATDAEKLQNQITKLDSSLTEMANRPRWLINEKEYDEKSALLQKLKDQLVELNRTTLGAEQAAKPAFDGVKKSIEATGEAAKESTKHITKMQEVQARGASIIATGSKYIGMGEGNQTAVLTKFLNEYSGTTAKAIAGEVNAWCARFVSAVLGEAKIGGLPTMSAKAYAGYGQAVWKQGMSAASLSEVMPGDIAIFTRKGGGGHVGFVKATDPGKGLLDILGGNQSNQVSIVQRSLKDLIAIRRVTGDSLRDFESAEQAIEKEKSAYEKAMDAKKKAADDAFNSVKLHQEDAIKLAEEHARVQVAKIKTSMEALKAEEEAQQHVTAAQIASARTVDEKQALIEKAARQSAAFHASEQSLVMAEIAQQQKLLEAKRAALTNELNGAQSGQYAQDESQQLAIKQAIRAVDTDLAQLAETRRQAEISAGAKVNEYTQQSVAMKAQELNSLQQLTAEYTKQQAILSQLQAAAASGASADELANLASVLQSMPSLDMYSQANIDQATKLNQGIAETSNQIKNLQTVDQQFAEQQLRLNAAFEDGVKQAQLFATHATEAFGNAGEGIGKIAVSIAQFFQQSYQANRDLGNELKAANDAFSKGQISETQRVQRELSARDKAATKSAQYQIGLFGDITSAARGYFKEGTKGYAALENATKVFRAFEMAMALKSMATQLLGTETMIASDTARTGTEIVNSAARGQAKAAEAVANQASGGDPYSAFPRAAAMAAMMAALGFAVVGSVMGGGQAPEGYAERQKTQGTGSVLGDNAAQSTSIEDSLAKIRDNSSNDLNYSAAMLTALQNIESALAGASAQIFTDVVPSIMGAISRSGISFEKNQWGPFEYTQKSVTDAGIMAVKQSLNTILKKGFEGLEYADITKKFSTLFGASYKTTEYTQTMGSQTAQQFTLVIRNMVEALKAGGKAFGLSADEVTARLKKFQVDIGRVSLQGLSGDEAKKAISAVFGKLYDGMADALKLGLNKFKQVGEGSATTFFRIAEAANRTQGELAQLGITMISLKDMANKRGQADEELFKQSYLASGKASQGLAQFIDRIHGTAQELKDAVIKFTDAENMLKSAGFDGAALQGNASGQSALIDRVGGLDNFLGLMQDFNDNFLTEAQRFAGASQQLSEQFADLGVAMPASKDSFYQLLMGIDKTTESGQKLFGALLKLNPEFAKLANQIQGIKDKYADILNPFGKYGAQITSVNDDFSTLITDASNRSASIIDAMTKNLNDQVAGYTNRQDDAKKMLDSLSASMASRQKQLEDATAVFDREMAKPPKKRNTKALNQAIKDIGEAQTAIGALQGFIDSSVAEISGYKDAINKLNEEYAGATGSEKIRAEMEKAGLLRNASTVMTSTLSDIFTQIQQSVDTARQKMEGAVTFQKSLATQIASLEGPDATAALMRSRAAEATRAVDDYWAHMSAGAARNTDEELRLLGEAQQAIMDKYNAELAAVQQLQQAVDSFNSAISSIRSQIATLQGSGAVATLASSNYGTAFQNIQDYRAGIAAGGTRDYAKEVTLIQSAQTAVMDKYNAEMALIQESAQVQAQALQDGLQQQIDGINSSSQSQIDAANAASEALIESINSASQAQIDAINAATESRIDSINSELELQQKSAQSAHDATVKNLQTQLEAAQKLTAAYQQIAEYAKSMKLGNLSTLSPEAKLAEAQRQYQDTLTKARSGDADAAAKLTGASDAYLESARAYYGSGTQYANIFDGVQAAMTQVGGLNGGNPDSIQAHIDQLNADFQTSQDALRKSAQDQIKAIQDAAKAQTEAAQQAARDQVKAAQDAAKAQTEAIQNAAAAQIKSLQEDIAQQIKDLNDPNKNAAMKALKDATITDLEALQKIAEEAKIGAEKAAGDAAKAAKQYQTETLNALKAIADKAEDTRREAAQQYADAKSDAIAAQNRAADEARKQLESLDATAGWSSQQKAALEAIARHLDPTFTMPGQVIPSHARGGYAQAGLALVGEQGPELVRFERPAQVLTAQQTREALNGESPKTFAALEAIKQELKAIVTTQSNANPQLIERLAAIEDRLNKMERNQRIQA